MHHACQQGSAWLAGTGCMSKGRPGVLGTEDWARNVQGSWSETTEKGCGLLSYAHQLCSPSPCAMCDRELTVQRGGGVAQERRHLLPHSLGHVAGLHAPGDRLAYAAALRWARPDRGVTQPCSQHGATRCRASACQLPRCPAGPEPGPRLFLGPHAAHASTAAKTQALGPSTH